MRKAATLAEAGDFEQLPNVGPRIAADLAQLGFRTPAELPGFDPLLQYRRLCRLSGQRQDPCVLDTFMAVADFARGAKARAWWHYTAERKRLHPQL